MNKAILLICALCVVAAFEVDACLKFGCQKQSKPVSMVGLNKWLEQTLPDRRNPGDNLDHLKSNLHKLRDPEMKRAAKLMIKFLKLIEPGHQCDDKMLTSLKGVLESDPEIGQRRVDSLMIYGLYSPVFSCGEMIDRKVVKLYETSLKDKLGNFMKVVVPSQFLHDFDSILPEPKETFDDYIEKREDPYLSYRVATLSKSLQELAKDDGPIREDNFSQVYSKYLEEPCKLLTSTLEGPISEMYGLQKFLRRFMGYRIDTVQELLYAFKQCKGLFELGPEKLAQHLLGKQ